MVFGGGAARRGDKPGAMAAHGADTNHHEEASRMLETALQQMDSIIAGTELELAGMEESVRKEPLALSDPVSQAAERLRQAITLSAKSASTPSETALTEETRHFLSTWLAGNNNNSSSSSNGKIRERDDLIQIWNTNAARHEEAKVVEKVRSLLPGVKFSAIFYKRHETHHAFEGKK